MSATTNDKPSVGLPPEQLQQWLQWVREDLQHIAVRIDLLMSEQGRLAEQERLLGELIATLPAATTTTTATATPDEPSAGAGDAPETQHPSVEALPRRDEQRGDEASPLPAIPTYNVSWIFDPPS